MDKMYLVYYYVGFHDDQVTFNIFVTPKKSTAVKYTRKFNRILDKWRKHYAQYEDERLGIKWIKDEYVESHYTKWYQIQQISCCYYQEIEVR